MTLSFDLTHDLDLGCFKVKFRNSSLSGIVGLIDVKWKGSELIWYRANCMTLPFDHTHDLDLGVSRSESEIALSQEWGDRLTWNEKDVSHPFMTMILICVTMVGEADLPDSDRVTSDVGVPSTYLVCVSSRYVCKAAALIIYNSWCIPKSRICGLLISENCETRWHWNGVKNGTKSDLSYTFDVVVLCIISCYVEL